jgi:hypothetical protein
VAFIRQNDLLFAYMALTLVAGLSGNDRRVAGAILDHYNKKTGQCDPSGDGLAAKLGIDRKTVVTATARLCGEYKFFRKVSHGGYSHRASYSPQWSEFRKIVDDWNVKMKGQETPSTEAETPHSVRRNDLIEWGENASQTDRINRSNKPKGTHGACGNVPERPEKPALDQVENRQRQALVETVNGLLKGSLGQANGTRSASHANAARQQATKRLDADLISLGLHAHADAMNRMDEGMQADAIAAEMRRRGAGLALLRERLGLAGGAA